MKPQEASLQLILTSDLLAASQMNVCIIIYSCICLAPEAN